MTLLGESVAYEFSPETVGTAVADHKAFYAVANGSGVSIKLEDMAGRVGSDWDYDDRSWELRVAAAPAPAMKGGAQASAASGGGTTNGGGGTGGGGTGGGETGDHQAGSGTQLDPWVWDDLNTKETASVWLAVTSEGTDHLRWTYTVTNDSLSTAEPTPGINRFHLAGADMPGVDDMTASIGWVPAFGGTYVNWQTPSELAGPYLAIGQTATFSFRTLPQPRVPGFGQVGLAGYPEVDPETGQTKLGTLPGLRPLGIVTVPGVDAVQVVLTDMYGNAVGKDGLKVAKWENAFDIAGGVARLKGVDPANGFNIIRVVAE